MVRLRILFVVFFLALSAHAQSKLKDADCLTCHADRTLSTDGKQGSLFVDEALLKHSIHGSMLSCVDCHTDVKSLVHDAPPAKVTCAQCHADAQQAYSHSKHALPAKGSAAPAATCQDCHGDEHQILAIDDAHSPVHHNQIPATCGRCHGQKFLMESNGETAQAFLSYQESVHGRSVEHGSQKAAVCTDCHGAHEILPPTDAQSPISKAKVPATCGKCHAEIDKAFEASIHGQAIARGNQLAPACTDCHGIHSIQSHRDPNSPTASQNISQRTCARCHEGVRLSREFGIPSDRVDTYFDSYHGLAMQGGSVVAANCSSCHGVHDILPSSDPRSTINVAHLGDTCGKCHDGVTAKFTQTRVHLNRSAANDVGAKVVRDIRWIYLVLIYGVIGAMFLHNAILWRSKMLARRRLQQRFVIRMTPRQRGQHLVLLISFIILVLTGFALKFPHSWLAEAMGMNERWRSLVHRIAGVVLVGAGVYHIVYAAVTREGRRLIDDLLPRPKDAKDAAGAMAHHLGLKKDRPRFGRFSYAEKAEYWALVWGTALMGLTGFMMWGKVWVGNLLARWWVDAATAVHFYEAILATLAIVVWHFYQVFFDPDVYPMNGAWWDGKMPEEQYRHEHPLDESIDTESVNPESHSLDGSQPSEETSGDERQRGSTHSNDSTE